ncbi:MAG: sensor histidine kinase [Pseudomonadota bacterium]
MQHLLTVHIENEDDVLLARQRTRQVAAACGFSVLEQARISTAVSELVRNAFNYAGGGQARFALEAAGAAPALLVCIADQGPGIAHLEQILAGRYRSASGQGQGILSARRLMDQCDIQTGAAGTEITVGKTLPAASPVLCASGVRDLLGQLATLPGSGALSEAQQQNRELASALAALQARQDELELVSAQLRQSHAQIATLNEALEEKAAALLNADRRKDNFLALLSHELRGPLSATGMAAQVLQGASLAPERAGELGRIVARQVGHMSHMVEDLLDVSRISRGLLQLERARLDLHDVVRIAVEQLSAAACVKQHVITVSTPDAPCWYLGDHTRLVQVVGNLLGNAIRYTPQQGAIEVRLRHEAGAILVQVADNGIGMAPELLPYLFDMYSQAEVSSERKTGGLGLGLALVKRLVEAHQGSASAHSDGPGQGSVFTVRLPALPQRAGDVGALPADK